MPMQLLINAKSGAVLRAGVEHCRALVAAHFPDQILEVVGSPAELIGAARAATADPTIDKVLLIAGDGTAAAIAGELAGTGTALVPLPGGTMNMLARDLGYSGDLETAIRELDRARLAQIDIAHVNDQPFLNNVVFGTFSAAAESREAIRDAATLAATASATADFISAVALSDTQDYEVVIDGAVQHVRTNTLMVANNLYTGSEQFRPTKHSLERGVLGVYIAEAQDAIDFISVIYSAISGNLSETEGVRLQECKSCSVSSELKRLNITIDGEVTEIASPAMFSIQPKALTVLSLI
jgi:diacylglycerol kinase family enzyme